MPNGTILHGDSVLNIAGVSRGLFAPAITYHKGIFYIVYTLVDKAGDFIKLHMNVSFIQLKFYLSQ